ncbi:hypothetical protein [Thermotoga sp. SG1]|uniref:hypothetical protein n=1 Tax=Thermotoga sp. SG1 TaxID=126739 RepID=UPI000C76D8EE|nr:hypothetical protein [Thermotoga sp. SG1]PLV56169.1 hypothetical protein AS006_06310 [Thermotoga sp. SG1]
MFPDVLFASTLFLSGMKYLDLPILGIISAVILVITLKRFSMAYLIILPVLGFLLWITLKDRDLMISSLVTSVFLIFSDFEDERSKVPSLLVFFAMVVLFGKNTFSPILVSGALSLYFIYEKRYLYSLISPFLMFVPPFNLPSFSFGGRQKTEIAESSQESMKNVIVMMERFFQEENPLMGILWGIIFWIVVVSTIFLFLTFLKKFRINMKVPHYVLIFLVILVVVLYAFLLFVNLVVQNMNLEIGVPELTPIGRMFSSSSPASVTIIEIERKPSWNSVRWALTIVTFVVAIFVLYSTLKIFLKAVRSTTSKLETEEEMVEKAKEKFTGDEKQIERREIHSVEEAYLFLRKRFFPGKDQLTPYELIEGERYRHFRELTERFTRIRYSRIKQETPFSEVKKLFLESEKELNYKNKNKRNMQKEA